VTVGTEEQRRRSAQEPGERRLFAFFEAHRAPIQIAADALVWLLALTLGWILRVEYDLGAVLWGRLALAVLVAWLLQIAVGTAEGLYTGRHRYGSFEEVAGLTRSLVWVITLGGTLNAVLPSSIPKSVPIIAGGLALIGMAGTRYAWRIVLEHSKRPTADGSERVLVFGAGEGASQLVTSMLRDKEAALLPVGLIDDDPKKRNLRLRGVPVVGTRERLPAAVVETKATVLAIAVPSASGSLIREVSELAHASDLRVLVLPPVGELLGGEIGVGQLRKVTAADLLGRHEIDTDVDSIAGYVTGKRVLITGAGGSIGS
jgi:FlaA1/EpsC-like NDP-sugar epimerase